MPKAEKRKSKAAPKKATKKPPKKQKPSDVKEPAKNSNKKKSPDETKVNFPISEEKRIGKPAASKTPTTTPTEKTSETKSSGDQTATIQNTLPTEKTNSLATTPSKQEDKPTSKQKEKPQKRSFSLFKKKSAPTSSNAVATETKQPSESTGKTKLTKEDKKALKEQKKSEKKKKGKKQRRVFYGLSGKQKNTFLVNLSMLLDSGMDVSSALAALTNQARNKAERRFFTDLHDVVDSGSPIWAALDDMRMFPSQVIALMRVGEESGQLPQNIRVIASTQEKNREFRGKLISALIYPIFVLCLAGGIGVGVAWFILPNLAKVFNSLDLKLPLVTRIFIAIGEFLGDYGHIAVPVGGAAIAGILFFLFGFRPTRFIGQSIALHTPGIGKMLKEVELARMGFMMHSLLAAGLPINGSLEALANAASLRPYKKFYRTLQDHLEHGLTFQGAFAQEKRVKRLFLGNTQYLIIAAEESGELPEAFQRVGKMFDMSSENSTKNFATMIEPVMLLFVWAGVIIVALAVILPVYGIIGGINGQAGTSSTPANNTPPPVTTESSTTEPEANDENGLETVLSPEDSATDTEENLFENLSENDTTTEENSTSTLKSLTILETPTGTLNVREEPSTTATIITTVTPGEQYPWLNQQDGWYFIQVDTATLGWVYGNYVEVITP